MVRGLRAVVEAPDLPGGELGKSKQVTDRAGRDAQPF